MRFPQTMTGGVSRGRHTLPCRQSHFTSERSLERSLSKVSKVWKGITASELFSSFDGSHLKDELKCSEDALQTHACTCKLCPLISLIFQLMVFDNLGSFCGSRAMDRLVFCSVAHSQDSRLQRWAAKWRVICEWGWRGLCCSAGRHLVTLLPEVSDSPQLTNSSLGEACTRWPTGTACGVHGTAA